MSTTLHFMLTEGQKTWLARRKRDTAARIHALETHLRTEVAIPAATQVMIEREIFEARVRLLRTDYLLSGPSGRTIEV